MQRVCEVFDPSEEVAAETALRNLRRVLQDLTYLGERRIGRLSMFHVKRAGQRQAQSAVARARPALIWTARIDTAAGVIPGIRAAWPSE